MTVRELIDRLHKLDLDMPIAIGTCVPYCSDSAIDCIDDIRKLKLWKSPNGGYTLWTACSDAVMKDCYVLCAIDWEE